MALRKIGMTMLWNRVVKKSVNSLNAEKEEMEDQKKNEKKSANESQLTAATSELLCDHPDCCFVAAGLINHKWQKHAPAITLLCEHCKSSINCQGFISHKRSCGRRSTIS